MGESDYWNRAMLAKFPTFSPYWSPGVIRDWFDAFRRLLELAPRLWLQPLAEWGEDGYAE